MEQTNKCCADMVSADAEFARKRDMPIIAMKHFVKPTIYRHHLGQAFCHMLTAARPYTKIALQALRQAWRQ